MQCQRANKHKQCENEALPDSQYCEDHTGRLTRARQLERQYTLQDVRVQQSVDKLAQSDAIYSLREEIAVLRKMNEHYLQALGKGDLAVSAPIIVQLTDTIQKLVKTGGSMEVKFGNMLTKETVLKLAQSMVDILAEEVDDADIVDRVTTRVADLIEHAENQE